MFAPTRMSIHTNVSLGMTLASWPLTSALQILSNFARFRSLSSCVSSLIAQFLWKSAELIELTAESESGRLESESNPWPDLNLLLDWNLSELIWVTWAGAGATQSGQDMQRGEAQISSFESSETIGPMTTSDSHSSLSCSSMNWCRHSKLENSWFNSQDSWSDSWANLNYSQPL